jgi:hypothetical protein
VGAGDDGLTAAISAIGEVGKAFRFPSRRSQSRPPRVECLLSQNKDWKCLSLLFLFRLYLCCFPHDCGMYVLECKLGCIALAMYHAQLPTYTNLTQHKCGRFLVILCVVAHVDLERLATCAEHVASVAVALYFRSQRGFAHLIIISWESL